MKSLLVGAWTLLAVDLVVLAMMVWQVWFGDFGVGETAEADRAYAFTVTLGMALWVGFVNLVLVLSWWRASRTGLWVAIVCGALPLLWAWTALVQAFTDWVAAPQ